MFFGLGKKASPDTGTIRWLKEVDIAYDRSSQVGNVQALEKYCTRACLTKLAEQIRMGGKEYAGLARYRHVTWEAENAQSDVASVRWIKTVCYDHVKMSRGVIIPVGDDYHERWLIELDAKSRLVSDIRRIS